jgi:hypothetical protein
MIGMSLAVPGTAPTHCHLKRQILGREFRAAHQNAEVSGVLALGRGHRGVGAVRQAQITKRPAARTASSVASGSTSPICLRATISSRKVGMRTWRSSFNWLISRRVLSDEVSSLPFNGYFRLDNEVC